MKAPPAAHDTWASFRAWLDGLEAELRDVLERRPPAWAQTLVDKIVRARGSPRRLSASLEACELALLLKMGAVAFLEATAGQAGPEAGQPGSSAWPP